MADQSKAAASRRLNVFLCHSSGDKQAVRVLYQRLKACNLAPWLDEENLVPGQDFELEIRKAVRDTDVVIVCLSHGSINRAGFVQKELRFALDVADEQPEGSIFIIPLRLEACVLPERLKRWHRVDYFEENGFDKLIIALAFRREALKANIKPIRSQRFQLTQSHISVVEGSQSTKLGISRRSLIVSLGLVGVVVAGVGSRIVWMTLAQRPPVSSGSTPIPKPTPTHTSIPQTATPTLFTYRGHTGNVQSVAWSPNSRYIASTGYDKTIQVWDAHVNINPSIPIFKEDLFANGDSVTWSPDGKYIATVDDNHFLYIWDWQAKNRIIFYDTQHSLRSVAWSPNGNYLAFASINDYMQVLDISNITRWQVAKTYVGHTGSVNAVAWSSDNRYLVSASKDTTVRIWQAPPGEKLVGIYTGHVNEVYSVAWASNTPNTPNIVSAGCDATVQVWNAFTQKEEVKYNFPGRTTCVRGVSWSPDGNYIVAGSWNGKVEVWKLTQSVPVFTYSGHRGAVSAVAWSPDGRFIASGSDDKTVQIWQVK